MTFVPQFTSRDETAAEHQARTGSTAGAGALVPSNTYQLVAGFAEHDERFGGSATAQADCQATPGRDEAERLVWPAVEAETERALGPGDWRPSLNWLTVVRLLDEAPAVEPAQLGEGLAHVLRHEPWKLTGAHRTSLDAFAGRYARSRRLSYEVPGKRPGPRGSSPRSTASGRTAS